MATIDTFSCVINHNGKLYTAIVTGEANVRITSKISGTTAILDDDSAENFLDDLEDYPNVDALDLLCGRYFEIACGE